MKKIICLSLVLLGSVALAQSTEGVITYERVIKIDTDRFPEEMRSMIPAERKSNLQLIFNSEEAIYKTVKQQEDINQEVTAGNDRMRFRMRTDESEFYTNLKKKTSLNKQDFFGRVFLIEGEDSTLEWKVTSEMKTVGKYQAIKATAMRDTIPVEAWFTPQIPVALGPGNYKGLPGMILHVSVNEGQQTITATNIDIRALTEAEAIVAPNKGKKVSREEFDKIREEKMAEMREMNGGTGRGGTVIIRN
ncbi:GLPGLI family protein [Ekhidna sp.]|uniref:GLPGLI family protein n=1 Tax=Ekhidna sp. TaxID=2608089 RepID=UPI00329705C0